MRQDNAQARERFTSSPATRLDPRLPLVKDAEDTVEVWIGNTYLDDSGRDSPASLNSTGDM